MKVFKYSTEHLECVWARSEKGQGHYQIYEKENQEKPVAIYINQRSMQLSNDFPKPERSYKYFKEMCEIVGVLVSAESQDLGNEQ